MIDNEIVPPEKINNTNHEEEVFDVKIIWRPAYEAFKETLYLRCRNKEDTILYFADLTKDKDLRDLIVGAYENKMK